MQQEKLNWKKLLFLSGAAFLAPTMAGLAHGVAPDPHMMVWAGTASVVTALYALFSNPRHRA